jgi:RNA polymerase sigma-70 factor (ECF subfamily)
MAAPTDLELLRAAEHRPEDFGVLFDRHARPLGRWILRQGVPAPEATELVSELFARAWAGRRRVKDERGGELGPWLHGIAANLVRSYHRKAHIESSARKKLGLPREAYLDESADERLDADREAAGVSGALEALPAEQGSAIRMRVIEERDYPEIARELAISEQTARKRVSAGLQRLRTKLERP